MTKPFCNTSESVLDHIDPTKPVRVYRNLHKKCISVKQGTLVRCHARNVVLKDCKFIVSEAGQKRVREQGRKNVHAFIEGHVIADRTGDFGWNTVYYNPYTTDHWVISNLPYDEYVETADYADVWCDALLGEVSVYNPLQEDGTKCS
jgi:hypothetical protein|tara:strand:- start:93 stop:533 length:441 start_codon:yes stop_codon:yes gene_type:complete